MDDSKDRYSADALDRFLRYLSEKGLMLQPTVGARRAACNKMLGVLTAEERQDLRSLDLEEVSLRFANLEGKNYTPDSLKTYKSRTSKAISDFLRYVDNPATFKVKSATRKLSGAKPLEANGTVANRGATPRTEEPPDDIATIGQLSVPVPIRENLIVTITGLPFDLSPQEASKIANVVRAMAVDPE